MTSGETQKILKILSVIPQTITNSCTEVKYEIRDAAWIFLLVHEKQRGHEQKLQATSALKSKYLHSREQNEDFFPSTSLDRYLKFIRKIIKNSLSSCFLFTSIITLTIIFLAQTLNQD